MGACWFSLLGLGSLGGRKGVMLGKFLKALISCALRDQKLSCSANGGVVPHVERFASFQ